jgi:hypothetical protein
MLRRVFLLLALGSGLLLAGLPPGRPLPDVPVLRPGAKPIDLKQYRGKPLVIAMLSTGCEECAQMVELLRVVQKDNPGLEVVGAVIEQNAAQNLPAFVQKHKGAFPIGYVELEDYRKLVPQAGDRKAGRERQDSDSSFCRHQAHDSRSIFGGRAHDGKARADREVHCA